MIELTTVQLIFVILASGITALLAGWFLGIFTFPWYMFSRARKDDGIDKSNKGQIDVPLAQMATHFSDFKKMYYLDHEQYELLFLHGNKMVQCFPDIGKDLSEYAMVRPPKQ